MKVGDLVRQKEKKKSHDAAITNGKTAAFVLLRQFSSLMFNTAFESHLSHFIWAWTAFRLCPLVLKKPTQQGKLFSEV